MMTFDDYKREVLADGLEALREGVGWWDGWGEAYEALLLDDAVTGNASGSYAFNESQALDNVLGLVCDEGFAAELEGAGLAFGEAWAAGPESLDVLARCLALGCVAGELERAWRAARG